MVSGRGRLTGKVAIVTGAARGIGRASAVAMAREGCAIVGIDIAGTVSDTLEVAVATREALADTGRLVEAEGARWHAETLDQREIAALRGAPYLVKRGGGRIIITSSTQGQHGTKWGSAYSASKWGLIGLMKSAALELGEHKITVNAVVPGLIDTPLTRHRSRYAQAVGDLDSPETTEELEAAAVEKLSSKSPLGVPWIDPADIAPAVVFLASDEARMISGASIDVTAGDSANITA